jgi:RNA-directed DNA polymerase
MAFSQEEYTSIAKKRGHSEEFIKDTILYANRLQRNNLPVIFSRTHLSYILGIHCKDLSAIIARRRKYYKTYVIRKKRGGVRQIMAPFSTLKNIQQYINQELLSNIAVNENAYGFIKNKSIYDNANVHKNQEAILKIDLLKFFDTINEKRVYGVFRLMGYAKNLAVDLARLTTVPLPEEYVLEFSHVERKALKSIIDNNEAVLPQGAPTSPALSNLILLSMDRRLVGLAKQLNVNYSRYADDITFSGILDRIPKISLLRHIIWDEGFSVNWEKVGIYKKGRRQLVTGLTISDGVHVPQKYKKDVKKHLYACKKYGVEHHLAFIKSNKGMYKEWLLGRICFIKSIESETGDILLNMFNEIDWLI